MIKNRIILGTFLFLTSFLWGQKKQHFPKDMIYVKYVVNERGSKKIMNTEYKGEKGVAFIVKDTSDIAWMDSVHFFLLFYSYRQPTDTLPLKKITNYHFSDLKEIINKRYRWVFDHNRPPLQKSQIFQTYLIEKISTDYFVKYPVIWRNEGVVP